MSIKSRVRNSDHNLFVLILIGFVLLVAPLFLFIDSPWIALYFSWGQDLNNVIMIVTYSSFLFVAKGKLYWLILLMTISSLFAEIIGSLILTLYQYRLKNIPMYVPLGHAIVYATTYYICKQPLIWRHHFPIEKFLSRLAFIIVILSLLFLYDLAGALCYILFLIILRYRVKKIFYLSMFIMVYGNELLGTLFSTWAWYVVVGNHPHYPTIGYTPSGMAGLYILIDLVSNSIYFYLLKIIRIIQRVFKGTRTLQQPAQLV